MLFCIDHVFACVGAWITSYFQTFPTNFLDMHWTHEQLTSLINLRISCLWIFLYPSSSLSSSIIIFLLFSVLHVKLTLFFFQIMGYKIFVHEIHSDYAARIDNFRSYDTVSKDIIHRWTYPLVPDVMNFGHTVTKLERQGMYRALGMAGIFCQLGVLVSCA